MAEHDYDIANAPGATVRADLNNALSAIVSQNSKATEPTTKFAYMPWVDTTNALFKMRNAANSAWITLFNIGKQLAELATAQTWTAAQRATITALTSGTTITPDFDDSNDFSVTLAHSVTLANPTNLTAGQAGSIFVTQDGTGSRTLAYGSYWKFGDGGAAPTASTAAGTVDRIDYTVESTTSIHAVMTNDVQ